MTLDTDRMGEFVNKVIKGYGLGVTSTLEQRGETWILRVRVFESSE
ncbi:MAG: hypothetical protein AAF645_10560 [Myxococcota bacterium]